MADETGQVGSPSPTQPEPKPKRIQRASQFGKPWQAKRTTVQHPPGTPLDRLGRDRTKKLASIAAKLEAKKEQAAPPRLVTVRLTMRHSRNGKFYGPGSVTVTPDKARAFLSEEADASEKELTLVQQQAFVIGMGHEGPVKRQVPWARFDEILGSGNIPKFSTGGER